MHWTEIPINMIDFEGNRSCGIVEFGVASLLRGEVTSTRSRLCRAQGEISSADYRLHGIRSQDTEAMEPFDIEWEYFRNLRRSGPLGAHYAIIENKLLKMVWPYPPNSPDFLNTGEEVADWGLWVDTCALYSRLFPRFESHNLRDLITTFHLQQCLDSLASIHCSRARSKYHCALYDALASAALLMHLSKFPGFEDITIEWLLTHSSPRGEREAQGKLPLSSRNETE